MFAHLFAKFKQKNQNNYKKEVFTPPTPKERERERERGIRFTWVGLKRLHSQVNTENFH